MNTGIRQDKTRQRETQEADENKKKKKVRKNEENSLRWNKGEAALRKLFHLNRFEKTTEAETLPIFVTVKIHVDIDFHYS